MNPVVQNLLVQNEIPSSFPFLVEVWKTSDTEHEEIERYVNATEDKEFEGHTFTASSFTVTPPERTENGMKDAQNAFSTIDQTWIANVRTAKERYKIRFIAVIDYEEDGTEVIEALDDVTFTLVNATWQETTIQFTMKFDDGMAVNMPCQKLTSFICPALF